MKVNLRGKFLIIFLILMLVLVNFSGINFGTSDDQISRSSVVPMGQPYNRFDQYIWGGNGSGENDKFGWNITYIENLNGDAYPDLVVGMPWYDVGPDIETGIVCVYYGKSSSGFDDLNFSKADVRIRGEGLNNKFGWDVADAGDVNGDGMNDLIVGAPGIKNGRGRAYIFYGGNLPIMASNADRILDGEDFGIPVNGNYGSSVAGAGDVDNDGFDDVIVGAPNMDQVILSYGYERLINFYLDLWDDDTNTPGVVKFDAGVNNYVNSTYTDNNTWGLDGEDDGWDWIDNIGDGGSTGLYGGDGTNDGVTHYSSWEPDGPDTGEVTWANRSALEITVGRNHSGSNNPYGSSGDNNPGGSGAWGIEFPITPETYSYLTTNSTIYVTFDYETEDTEGFFNGNDDTEEWCSIRSRIWDDSTPGPNNYIGNYWSGGEWWITRNRGGWGGPWGPISDTFKYDISSFINQAGSYYWDFGCHLGTGRFGPDEGIIAFFTNVAMYINSNRNVLIQGAANSGFGTALTGLGDINNDNYADIAIGAPNLDGGHVAIFDNAATFQGSKQFGVIQESISVASMILTGKNNGDKFGQSISLAGDVDNDGLSDLLIGAPGGNYADLYFGSTLSDGPIVPDLSENLLDKATPYVEFDEVLTSTGNTPGWSGANDGWDSWNGAYGSDGTPGSSTEFNYEQSINPTEIKNDGELIVAIGRSYGNSAEHDSGAYGVKFSVTSDMITALNLGGNAVVCYDWLLDDTELDATDGGIWIRTYLRNNSDTNYDRDLGWDIDGSQDNEVFHMSDPDAANDFFVQGHGDYFSKAGSYYIDFGGRVEGWASSGWDIENGVFHFDNFGLYITPAPDIKFVGTADSGFGTSLSYCNHLNNDDYSDILIGAPYYDSPNGDSSGAIFGFFTGPTSESTMYSQDAEFLHFGENQDDNFGFRIAGEFSFDNDDYDEIAVGAINYDTTNSNAGRIYLFSITKIPRIRLHHPVGGEIISGEVPVNATVNDPDDNIDTGLGVYFYYRQGQSADWTIIGNDVEPSIGKGIYEATWDTTMLPDGIDYYVMGDVVDLNKNRGENISMAIMVDNPHKPSLSIQNPAAASTIKGIIDINALVKDSALDLIGGGINSNIGVKFYFSENKTTWELLGTSKAGSEDVYSIKLDAREYSDGEYWIKVNATDLDGFEVEEIISINIDNPQRGPGITLLSPINIPVLSGDSITVSATAFDFDKNINSTGVTFLLSPETSPASWETIGNDPTPMANSTGADIYSIKWDTTTVQDNWYQLKAIVNDTTGLNNESMITKFNIHNELNNPPQIELISPQGGEIVDTTEVITARVRDLEDNIDPNGVFYYFSADKVQWKWIGTMGETRPTDDEYYDIKWFTDQVPDGEYWLNVTVSDLTNLKGSDVSDEPVIVHNTNKNPPIVRIIAPTKGQNIDGNFKIEAIAFDMENNIDSRVGVTFSYSSNNKDWIVLSNVKTPTDGDRAYELSWDTTMHSDGKYWLFAETSDTDDLKAEAYSDYFYIHNENDNPPGVTFLSPNAGEINGTVKINASVFDLENNLDTDGVNFYYSNDKETWTLIGNDPTATQTDDGNIHEFYWNTVASNVPDGIYWLKAQAIDLTELVGFDLSDEMILVHNNINNPPKIERFVEPEMGVPLKQNEFIVVEIIDFEEDIETVSFYYSKDNVNWELIIGNVERIQMGNKRERFKTMWVTEDLSNGDYYLMARAVDKVGKKDNLTAGPFEVTEGKDVKGEDKKEPFLSLASGSFMWILVIIIIIVIMIIVVMFILKRSKKREKELIEEVAAEVQQSQVLQGEAESTPFGGVEGGYGAEPGGQTYIPPTEGPPALMTPVIEEEPDVETIESYKAQVEIWRTEGYNIASLEQMSYSDEIMFARTFPIVSSNISRLKNITGRLDTMNTTGFEAQAESIRAKLYDPDQALAAEEEFRDLESKCTPSLGTTPDVGTVPELPQIEEMIPQLMPAPATDVSPPTTVEGASSPIAAIEPVQQTEVPLDIDLPPGIDLPPDTTQEPVLAPTPEPAQPQPTPAVTPAPTPMPATTPTPTPATPAPTITPTPQPAPATSTTEPATQPQPKKAEEEN